jgi:hypothetical protein
MTAELPLAECTLDLDGLRRQRDRYRRLGRWVESIGRWDDELVVRFAPASTTGFCGRRSPSRPNAAPSTASTTRRESGAFGSVSATAPNFLPSARSRSRWGRLTTPA